MLRTSLKKFASSTISISKNSISKSYLPSSGRLFSTAACSSVIVDCLPNEATPWLMLKPEIDEATGDKLERFYSPGENKLVKMNRSKCVKASNSAKCVGSTLGGWLGYVDPDDCSVMLSNPYSNKVIQLPSVTTLPSVLDFQRDSKTGAIVGIRMPLCDCHHTEKSFWTEDKEHTEEIVADMFANMALSFNESVVVASQGRTKERLVYCPISRNQSGDCDGYGVGGSEWVGLQEEYDPGINFHQAVYSSKSNMFYTMFLYPGIQAYDLESNRKHRSKKVLEFSMGKIFEDLEAAAKEDSRPKNAKVEDLGESRSAVHFYLVPTATGDLLLLKRHFQRNRIASAFDSSGGVDGFRPYETVHFDVYKVDFPMVKLERVTNLEKLSFFIGKNQSFSVVADDVPGIRANCIYFSDDRDDAGCDNGIFNLSDHSVFPLAYDELEKEPSSQGYSTFWVAPRFLIN